MEEKIYIDSTDNIKLCALLANVSQDKIVLLCHGIRGNKDERGSFIELAKEIQKQGYSTIRIDFRAHGESTGIDYETNISKEIEDIEAVLKFLESIGYKEIIVLGASFGASVVSLVDYSKFYTVKALILWYGALDNYDVLRTDDFLSEKNKKIALRDGFYKSYNKSGKLFRFGISLFDEINRYKPKDNIQKINLPKLFVHGLEDETVPYEVSVEVCSKCVNSKLELIENGNHTFDADKKALQDAIYKTIDFIKKYNI